MPIDRGCVYEKNVTIKNRSDGRPVDISTWQFDASLKDEADNELLAMSTSGGHFTVLEGDDGFYLKIALTEAETEALTPGQVSFVLYRSNDGRKRLGRGSDLVRDPE